MVTFISSAALIGSTPARLLRFYSHRSQIRARHPLPHSRTGRLYLHPWACGVNYVFHLASYGFCMPTAPDTLFKTLADPTRRAIFERLNRDGEQTVGALTAQAGVSQPAVSKHLGVLKQAGLVRDRHEGRQTHYSAQLGALAPLIDWTSQMAGFWQSRFDQLEDLLKRQSHQVARDRVQP